jgi:hypothetical protein
MEDGLAILKTSIPELTYDPELKVSQQDICKSMFTTALFPRAKVMMQPKSLSMEEILSKMWYMTMQPLRRKEILSLLQHG